MRRKITNDTWEQIADKKCEAVSRVFEIALVLVRLDHVAGRIVNADRRLLQT
jgi:hypothetical protein